MSGILFVSTIQMLLLNYFTSSKVYSLHGRPRSNHSAVIVCQTCVKGNCLLNLTPSKNYIPCRGQYIVYSITVQPVVSVYLCIFSWCTCQAFTEDTVSNCYHTTLAVASTQCTERERRPIWAVSFHLKDLLGHCQPWGHHKTQRGS